MIIVILLMMFIAAMIKGSGRLFEMILAFVGSLTVIAVGIAAVVSVVYIFV